MPNQSGKIVLVLVLVLLVLGAAVYFFSPSFRNKDYDEQVPSPSTFLSEVNTESNTKIKDYYSKNLKIKVELPEEAEIEERFTDILLNMSAGTIQIRRVGTNFSNINDYYENLKEKNRSSSISQEFIKVNSYDGILVTMNDPNITSKILKEYLVYIDSNVFKFSTSDRSLYPILDQVVQSFEYKP